jgi:hypothetical protein
VIAKKEILIKENGCLSGGGGGWVTAGVYNEIQSNGRGSSL